MQAEPVDIYPCGDHAVTVQFGNSISTAVNARIMSLFRVLQEEKPPFILDIIPAYHTVTVVYDAASLTKLYGSANRHVTEMLRDRCTKAIGILPTPRKISIPVCYAPAMAPDLQELAASKNISTEEIVRMHTGASYRVYMIGFLPGFAYMGKLDEKLVAPRKTSPRRSVPGGSIGIAGEQTGIYPFDSPGGWQLIGRTPLKMFDPSKPDPCLLQAGDEVRFYSISLSEFDKMYQP